jgi:hypothetical protein
VHELYSPASTIDIQLRTASLAGWPELQRAFHHEISLDHSTIDHLNAEITRLSTNDTYPNTLASKWDSLKELYCEFHTDRHTCITCRNARVIALDLMGDILGHNVEPVSSRFLTLRSGASAGVTDQATLSHDRLDTALIKLPQVFHRAFTYPELPQVPIRWMLD